MNSKKNFKLFNLISFFILIILYFNNPAYSEILEDSILEIKTNIIISSNDKYDPKFNRLLELYFPDPIERKEYQLKQEEIIRSTRKRIMMSPKTLKLELTAEEKDAEAYFAGTGIYKYYQDVNERPNIWDTRHSFVLKMHNPEFRRNFLNSYNKRNKLSDSENFDK